MVDYLLMLKDVNLTIMEEATVSGVTDIIVTKMKQKNNEPEHKTKKDKNDKKMTTCTSCKHA